MKLTGKLAVDKLPHFAQKTNLRYGRRVRSVWILVADSFLARIYKKNHHHMELIGEMEPDKEIFSKEINNQTIGRVFSPAGSKAHQKFEPHMEEGRKSELKFTREVSNFLKQAEAANVFDSLLIVAAPRMLGDLRTFISKSVQARIMFEIDKDFTKLNNKELELALKKIIWF